MTKLKVFLGYLIAAALVIIWELLAYYDYKLSEAATKGLIFALLFIAAVLNHYREANQRLAEDAENRVKAALVGKPNDHFRVAASLSQADPIRVGREAALSVAITSRDGLCPEQVKCLFQGAPVKVRQDGRNKACSDFIMDDQPEFYSGYAVYTFRNRNNNPKQLYNAFHLAISVKFARRARVHVTVQAYKSTLDGQLTGDCRSTFTVA